MEQIPRHDSVLDIEIGALKKEYDAEEEPLVGNHRNSNEHSDISTTASTRRWRFKHGKWVHWSCGLLVLGFIGVYAFRHSSFEWTSAAPPVQEEVLPVVRETRWSGWDGLEDHFVL